MNAPPINLMLCFAFACASGACLAQSSATIGSKTSGMSRRPGFIPFYWDEKAGKIWLEIEHWDREFLYINSLPAGLGSNDIGLDRGQLGGTRIVRFQRRGPKVLLVQPNYRYRASAENPAERRAVEESFAQSVLWGFTVEAEEGGRALVDATAFFLRDAHDVSGALQRGRQGAYRLEATRSALHPPRTRNFPRNTEVESLLTWTAESPGGLVASVAPSAAAVTLRQHHSFVELPEPGYRPRRQDPRAGYFGITYLDYSTPVGEPIAQRFLARHRIEKKDPRAPVSEPARPIVYYLDPGAPEPIRSALLEGASWWSQAFEAAGFRNAFQVMLLPEDADPMDVRYNIIQWVHRSTRGWSYGSSITDPRTGEIIKGQVTLGSLRVRQDYLIAEGLLAPYESGRPAPRAMEEMALARLRQLSAHEVGHTLGLAHNFTASASGRASVMDYPHPLVRLPEQGPPDLGAAYATGVGEWDKLAIAYGYGEFPPGADEQKSLEEMLRRGHARGLYFLSDIDARPAGGSHPSAHLWDNGPDAVAELEHILRVRARALERFSENNIREGAPLSLLEEVLAPVYLLHRYQTEAAAKVLGGVRYTYALRGDGQKAIESVAPGEQRRALEALLATLRPATLALPERLLRLIPPRTIGYTRPQEVFRGRTGWSLSALAPAEAASGQTVALALHPERAARLVEQHARDPQSVGLEEVITRLIGATWRAPRATGYLAEIARVADNAVLHEMMSLAANESAAPQARAMAWLKLDELRLWMNTAAQMAGSDSAQKAHLRFAAAHIRRFQDDPKQVSITRPPEPPPGQPIGESDAPGSWRLCDWE